VRPVANLAVIRTRDPFDARSLADPHASSAFVELLIVDEADQLKTPGLEQLRDHYDHSQLGMILIGMPGIEKRLARYPQLYSRIGFVHEYRPLSADELTFVLQRHWSTLGLTLSVDDFTTPRPLPRWRGSPAGTSGSSTASSPRSPASWRSTGSTPSVARSLRPLASPW
jgi:hypothetical protein